MATRGRMAGDERRIRVGLPGDRASDRATLRPAGQALVAAAGAWVLPFATALTAFRAVGDSTFVADARFLIEQNTWIRTLDHLWGNLVHDYFWSSSGNSIPYWRPLTKLSWLLEYQVFGADPRGYHVVQLMWHGLGAVGVGQLARQALGLRPVLATLAAVLFALHPLAPEPVCLVMARSDVVAVACLVWAMVLWWRWWTTRRWWWCLAHLTCVALALASKEAAVVAAPLTLALAAARAAEDTDASPGRWRRVARAALPTLLVVLVYLVARRSVLGPGGLALSFDPARWIAGLGFYLPALLPLGLDSGLRFVSPAEALSGAVVLRALVSLAVTVGLCWLLWRRAQPAGLALVAWVFVALAPVLLVAVIHVPNAEGRYPMAARWGYHAAAPACLLAAWLVSLLRSPRARRLVLCALAGWAVAATVAGPQVHQIYASPAAHLEAEDRALAATPRRFRTMADRCLARDRRVVRALIARRAADAASLAESTIVACGATSARRFNLLSALVAMGRLTRAAPVADALLAALPADRRDRAVTYYLAAVTMVHRGRLGDAKRLLGDAERLGLHPSQLDRLRARVRSRRGRSTSRRKPSAHHQ